MVEVRKATIDDIPKLLPLVQEYWRFESIAGFHQSKVEAQLRRLFLEPRLGCGFISISDGVTAGYLLGVYVFSLEHLGITVEIDEFFVLASQRSQGIGTMLLRAAELEFQRVDCLNISLQLGKLNHAARTFYQRRHFVERSNYQLLEKTIQDESSK